MNSTNRKANPVELLENYRSDTQTIAILRRALNDRPHASAEEIISTMNFGHCDAIGSATNHISDKTAYIALHYEQKMDDVNYDAAGYYAAKLWRMELERDRLNFYVSLLERRQRKVIELYYMEGISREEIAADLGVTVRTFHKIRKQALDRLAEMYKLTEKLDQ